VVAEHLLGGTIEHVGGTDTADALGRVVHLDDLEMLIEGDHPIRQRFQDALIIVLEGEHVGEQLRVLDRDRDL
jgi:hypothetical protein